MELRVHIRPRVSVTIGDGLGTNAWEDSWLPCGPLSSHVSYRYLCRDGLCHDSTVRDMVTIIGDNWPEDWLCRCPGLSNEDIPSLVDVVDKVVWRDANNAPDTFSAFTVWQSLYGTYPEVGWHKVIWFSGAIPKHAICIWQVCYYRLPTQDRILTWKQEPPDQKCPFCGLCPDSHNHLFFQCQFPLQVWRFLKREVHLLGFPETWDQILVEMHGGRPQGLLQKLTLAAAVYVIWQERNLRIFQNRHRSVAEVTRTIKDVVLMRMAWKKRRNLLPDGF